MLQSPNQPLNKNFLIQENRPSTWIEINTAAIIANIWLYKKAAPDSLFMPIIKANAYGHGIELIARLCNEHQAVDIIGVVSLEEAIYVRSLGIKKRILILSILSGNFEKVTQLNLETIIYDYQTALILNELGKKNTQKIKVHLKVDTGLCRLGIAPDQAFVLAQALQELEWIELEGIFTHLAESESDDATFTKQQLFLFYDLVERLKNSNITIPLLHASNSAAISAYPISHTNLIRAGIGIYGLWPSSENKKMTQKNNPLFILQPALTWKTKIIQLKIVPNGSYIGYDRTYQTTRVTKLALLPVGYADGLDRKHSNKGFVLINNQRAPIIGRIAMNICMVDVTDHAIITQEDEVILLGANTELNAETFAKLCEMINYEAVARINPMIARVMI